MFAADATGVWLHYAATTVLPGYVVNAVVLGVSVALCASVMGWRVRGKWRHDFPLRGFLAWALLLPMAMPAYVAAYALTDYFQFSGPVQSWLRATLAGARATTGSPSLYRCPAPSPLQSDAVPLRLSAGAHGVCRTRRRNFETARTLGLNRRQAWWRAAFAGRPPCHRRGALLVTMETLC